MRKRDKASYWHASAAFDWGCDSYMDGDNRVKNRRLEEVQIGEWFKAKLIAGPKKNSREIYLVQFGDQSYVVRINDKGEAYIRLQWADSFVEAKPENIGQLTNSTANAKRKIKK